MAAPSAGEGEMAALADAWTRIAALTCFHLGLKAEDLSQDSEEEKEGRDGLTCAVCLDIYVCPYVCRPCGHSFCEPCLRTIANDRPMNTPCPLCRSLISHTDFNKGKCLTETGPSLPDLVLDSRRPGNELQAVSVSHLSLCLPLLLFLLRARPVGSDTLPQSLLHPPAELQGRRLCKVASAQQSQKLLHLLE